METTAGRWFFAFEDVRVNMIELKGVSKQYPQVGGLVTGLYPTDLQIKKGEIFGLMGVSGAGKSTLLRMVNLLEEPSTGEVWVDNLALRTLSAEQLRESRRHMGMIFQHFNLLSLRTVFDNIALPLELAGVSKTHIAQRVNQLLALTELTDKQHAYPGQLSGGQKQRVAIARALAYEPKLLLCDEATSALDPQTTRTILQLLKKINKELGLTILLITHEMDVIKQICDRVAVLDGGKKIEEGDVLDIFMHPRHEITKQFVATVMHSELPEKWAQQLMSQPQAGSIPLLKLTFYGEAAMEPLVTRVMQVCATPLNIMQAHVGMIQDKMVGIMIVSLENVDVRDKVVAFLRSQAVFVEVLGYVASIH